MQIKLADGWAAQYIADDLLVEPGEPIEVDDALGASLLEQVDKWLPVDAAAKAAAPSEPSKPKRTRKAAKRTTAKES